MQAYSNPADEADPHKLPDLDIFYHQHVGPLTDISLECPSDDDGQCGGTGHYWCYCQPGCIPDSQWFGPYEMYELALVAAREDAGVCNHQWEEQEGEPPVDVCQHCGEKRS